MSSPGFRSGFTSPSAMPPTKPPSMYILATGFLLNTRPMPSTNEMPRAVSMPPATYLSLTILTISSSASLTVWSLNGRSPLNSFV